MDVLSCLVLEFKHSAVGSAVGVLLPTDGYIIFRNIHRYVCNIHQSTQ